MKWLGEKEMVVGEVDENGKVIIEFRIQPGEEIPQAAMELLSRKEEVTNIPYDIVGHYDRKLVQQTFKKN